MNRKIQKEEAIKRMKLMKLFPTIIEEFEKEDVVNMSENGGMLFWLNDKLKELVKEFEEKYNALVYHIIHNYTEFGELYSLFYVSKHKDEWDYDKDDIAYKRQFVYVINVDDDSCSEFGTIGFKERFGGLMRTC